ncbi:hypothetical protein ES319_D07G027500v1, partial [Gossypium barbadense]
DGVTNLNRYKGQCYHIKPVPREKYQYISYVAYPLYLFLRSSVTNMFTSIVDNVFGFKALSALLERDKLNKYGHLILGYTIKHKLRLSAKNYGKTVYECLHGKLDFIKDDEN